MNPQVNAILEHIHALFTNMIRKAELDMAKLVIASYIDVFLSDTACVIGHGILAGNIAC
jgi:hypothetical protein